MRGIQASTSEQSITTKSLTTQYHCHCGTSVKRTQDDDCSGHADAYADASAAAATAGLPNGARRRVIDHAGKHLPLRPLQ